MIKGKKNPQQVEIIADYREDEPPFPAIRVKKGGNEWIVKPEEIYTTEELREYENERLLAKRKVKKEPQ